MQITSRFDHYNFNVLDLDKSINFYDKALGLKEKRRKVADDGSFILVFLDDGRGGFALELTWLRDWDKPYEMGDNEVHLCMKVDGDYTAIREYHRSMGCICYENMDMGLYFITDPDDHWIEIVK